MRQAKTAVESAETAAPGQPMTPAEATNGAAGVHGNRNGDFLGAFRLGGDMERFLWICFGGALGTGVRYLVSGWVFQALGSAFPYGTLAVNLFGSFLLGATMHLGLHSEWMSPTARLAVTTGALGGFTTYSTFSYETARLLQEGAWFFAGLNVAVTVLACLAASFLGFAAGRWLSGG